ncbi:hypothetical protein ACFY1V_13085 [Streptomyces sp. NPDC001255]|uniref:hypothetical protein n=1 Tax=Streptomyces sp. NPDC001255 TaxID=3364550 RepID=UPI0036CC345F
MLKDRFVFVRRDPDSGEVLARGGDTEAHAILQRAGFVPVVRPHQTYHRAPAGLAEKAENQLATEAVARLKSALFPVIHDRAFQTERLPLPRPTAGGSVAHLAEHIREATTTDEAAAAIAELTAPGDGVLDGLAEVLEALADFHDGLGGPADPHVATRLRYLAGEYLGAVHSDLLFTRTALADQHAAHPTRTACPGQAPGTEQERSATCSCPPPNRPTTPVPPPVRAVARH